MNVPKEVRHAFAALHQDVFLGAETHEELVDWVVMLLTDETRPVVHVFLEALLDGSRTRGEIRGAFEKTDAEVRFAKTDELIAFLCLVRDRLRN